MSLSWVMDDEDDKDPRSTLDKPSSIMDQVPPRLDQIRLRHLTKISYSQAAASSIEIYTARGSSCRETIRGPRADWIIDEALPAGEALAFGIRVRGDGKLVEDWFIEDARVLREAEGDARASLALTFDGLTLVMERQADSSRRPLLKDSRAGYGLEDISTLMDLQLTLEEARQERQSMQSAAGVAIRKTNRTGLGLALEQRDKDARLRRKQVQSLSERVRCARVEKEHRQRAIERRRQNLASVFPGKRALSERCATLETEAKIQSTLLTNLRAHARQLRLECLHQIAPIYPVEETTRSTWSVAGVQLAKKSEAELATALGHLAHLVSLISSYWEIHLVYPVVHVGSKSGIKDPVSCMTTERTGLSGQAFPLYPRSFDRYRFEYAVYLLGKDIELLCQTCHLQVKDVRNLGGNLAKFLAHFKEPEQEYRVL